MTYYLLIAVFDKKGLVLNSDLDGYDREAVEQIEIDEPDGIYDVIWRSPQPDKFSNVVNLNIPGPLSTQEIWDVIQWHRKECL